MHSETTIINKEYNHVLINLQDYMLNGKVLARTYYQHSDEENSKRNNKNLKNEKQQHKHQYNQQNQQNQHNQQPQPKIKKEQERFFYPSEKDQLFWCFYIIQHGFEKYEYPGITAFVNEKAEKFKCIEHLRTNKQQLKIKKIKNIREDIEDELANKQTIGMKTFIALCIAHNINIMYIHKRKCFEIVFDNQSPVFVVHCINNADSSAFKYCYEQNVSPEQLSKYREDYFNWESIEKPLKAISSYKVDELCELCKKLGLTETNPGLDLSKKTKKYLYELLVMSL